MARYARIVVRDCPHRVTALGNRSVRSISFASAKPGHREPIFFENGDHVVYGGLLAEQAEKAKVEIWAYCPRPNHLHNSAA